MCEFVNLPFGLILGQAVTLLKLSDELFALSADDREVEQGEHTVICWDTKGSNCRSGGTWDGAGEGRAEIQRLMDGRKILLERISGL